MTFKVVKIGNCYREGWRCLREAVVEISIIQKLFATCPVTPDRNITSVRTGIVRRVSDRVRACVCQNVSGWFRVCIQICFATKDTCVASCCWSSRVD